MLVAAHQTIRESPKNVYCSSEQNFIAKLSSHATLGKQQFWSVFAKIRWVIKEPKSRFDIEPDRAHIELSEQTSDIVLKPLSHI